MGVQVPLRVLSYGRVAELVDAAGLEPVEETRKGSSPFTFTKLGLVVELVDTLGGFMASKYTKESLKLAVKDSMSLAGVIRFYGIKCTGGNYWYIKRKITV